MQYSALTDPFRALRGTIHMLYENGLTEEAVALTADIDAAQLQAWEARPGDLVIGG